jgi:hypothetical protein
MASDADAAVVATMIARVRARGARGPVAARRGGGATVLVVAGLWWFCVPPFEYAYAGAGPGGDAGRSR